jgi:group I intron endonuclease
MTGYIYLITNRVNGKKYVGATKVSINTRWSQHRSLAKKGSQYALHLAIQKYGKEAFSVACLETVQGEYADLMAAEIRQILAQNSLYPKGYNLTKGGEGIDFSTPGIRERHAEGIRKRESNPANREAHAAGIARRETDPECKKARADGIRKMTCNPKWPEICALAGVKRSLNPVWRRRTAEGQQKRFAAQALVTDAHLSPEEVAKKQKVRERNRLRMAKKRQSLRASRSLPDEMLKAVL